MRNKDIEKFQKIINDIKQNYEVKLDLILSRCRDVIKEAQDNVEKDSKCYKNLSDALIDIKKTSETGDIYFGSVEEYKSEINNLVNNFCQHISDFITDDILSRRKKYNVEKHLNDLKSELEKHGLFCHFNYLFTDTYFKYEKDVVAGHNELINKLLAWKLEK